MIKKTIAVLGMRCAGCSASVEETLNKLEGVQSASVNLASRSALIEFDEKRVTPERMKAKNGTAEQSEIEYDMLSTSSLVERTLLWNKTYHLVDKIYMDKDKKDILIRDIPFFEPDNIEATRQKIEADFEKTQQLKMVISSFSNLNEEKNTIQNEVQSKKTSVILQPL